MGWLKGGSGNHSIIGALQFKTGRHDYEHPEAKFQVTLPQVAGPVNLDFAPACLGQNTDKKGQYVDLDALGLRLSGAFMISPGGDDPCQSRGYFVAKNFTLDRLSGYELLTVSAQGQFICFLNGTRLGQDLLTPGWTAYDKRLSYLTYDASTALRVGLNRIEIWLTDGWYRTRLLWNPNPISQTYGDRIGAIAPEGRHADLAAGLHLHGIPLCPCHGHGRGAGGCHRVGAALLGARSARRLHLRPSSGQPAGAEHRLVAAVELHRGADRLPAARRTAGLDRRCAGLCGHRLLAGRQPRLPAQVPARRDGRPARGRRDPAFQPRPDPPAFRARAWRLGRVDRLGRCDHDHPLAAVPALRRHRRAGNACPRWCAGWITSGAFPTAR
jgi:hypothetical protein